MRIRRNAGIAIGVSAAALLSVVVSTLGQTTELQLVPPESKPAEGSFYSLQQPDFPPLPFNLFPELPLYFVEADKFLIDDTSVDYQAVEESSAMTAPQSLSSFSLESRVRAVI